MEVWNLVLEFIKVLLSWPVVLLAVAVIFKKQISTKISSATTYEGFGQSLTFDTLLKSADESNLENAISGDDSRDPIKIDVPKGVDSEKSDQDSYKKSDNADDDTFGIEAEEEPSWLLLSTWDKLMSEMHRTVSRILPGQDFRRAPLSLLMVLQRSGILNPSEIEQLDGLRRMRNEVAHGRHHPSSGEAIVYVQAARRIMSRMDESSPNNLPQNP